MERTKRSWLRLLIPGFVFQSAVIGGGYGTGAEIKEYFLTSGFVGGLMGLCVTLVLWSVLCAVSFEFTRVFKTYDYKSMMTELLGKAAFVYEIAYFILVGIVLGVINATAGSMVADLTGLTGWVGVGILAFGMIFLVLKGTEMIEKVLSFWSYVLYAVYILFMIICFTRFGGVIMDQLALHEVNPGALTKGAQYAFYNLGIVPALLYTVRDCRNRKEAVVEGLLSGVLAIIPAVLLLFVIAGVPAVMTAEVPVTAVFQALDMRWLYWLFEIVLFGTLIETGTAFIKAIDDRIEHAIEVKKGSVASWVRPVVAVVFVAAGIGISSFGLVPLIAKGYGFSNWAFLIVYVIPMMTLGIYKIAKATKKPQADVSVAMEE